MALARFMIRRSLPEHTALLAQMREGAEGVYALTPEVLGRVDPAGMVRESRSLRHGQTGVALGRVRDFRHFLGTAADLK